MLFGSTGFIILTVTLHPSPECRHLDTFRLGLKYCLFRQDEHSGFIQFA